jgi:hypothetical protein
MERMRTQLLTIAVVLTAAIAVGMTCLCARLSSCIVTSDEVWAYMDTHGHETEHMAAEVVHQLRHFGLVPLVSLVSIGAVLLFLVLCRRTRRASGHSGDSVAGIGGQTADQGS